MKIFGLIITTEKHMEKEIQKNCLKLHEEFTDGRVTEEKVNLIIHILGTGGEVRISKSAPFILQEVLFLLEYNRSKYSIKEDEDHFIVILN